jgi:hypothetical protein
MEFDKHGNETDPQQIDIQKANAVRALANYMLFESGSKDVKVKKAMDTYHTTSVDELNSKTKPPTSRQRK